jgi:hypothetical protein
MDAKSLKQRLTQLQREQGKDATPGVHYSVYDVKLLPEAKKAARHERQRNAIALTPSRPTADGAHGRLELTPGDVPVNPRHASLVDRGVVVATGDAASKRDLSMPFAPRLVDTAADQPAAIEQQDSRVFHTSQQSALNAEMRLAAETSLDAWSGRMRDACAGLLAMVNDGPSTAAAHVALLRTYEDNYQCVYPLDDSVMQMTMEQDLKLQLAAPSLRRLTEELAPLDRETLAATLDDLSAGPYRGPATVMPEARLRQRHATVKRLDDVADGQPIGDATLRLYEDLYRDVLGPVRQQLEEGEHAITELLIKADDAQRQRQVALDAATAERSADEEALARALRHEKSLADVAKYQRLEVLELSELVKEHALRHGLMDAALQSVLDHAARCVTDLGIASSACGTFARNTALLTSSAANDAQVLRQRAETIADEMLAQHRRFLHEQAVAHNTTMALQAEEQAVWAEVAAKAAQAVRLGDQRRELILHRLRAREEEALRQRVAAQELSLVRRRLHQVDNAVYVLGVHRDAIEQLETYNDEMRAMLQARDVVREHDDLWREETSRAMSHYARGVIVTDDLSSRHANHLMLVDKQRREAELDFEMAVDTLDPDAAAYRDARDALLQAAAVLQRQFDEIAGAGAEMKTIAEPIAKLFSNKAWEPTEPSSALRTTRTTLRQFSASRSRGSPRGAAGGPLARIPEPLSPATTGEAESPLALVDDEGDMSDHDDPKYTSTRDAVRLQLEVQDMASQLKEDEQSAADLQLSNIRAIRADVQQSRRQHRAAQEQRQSVQQQKQQQPEEEASLANAAAPVGTEGHPHQTA